MQTLRRLLLLTFLCGGALLVSFSEAYASKCSCIAETESKTYQHFSEHWWGTKRAWSCIYSCKTPQGPAQVLGFHKSWYAGKDDGREGVCDGVPFRNQYSMHIGSFIWIPLEAKAFDPAKSSSTQIKEFAETYCK